MSGNSRRNVRGQNAPLEIRLNDVEFIRQPTFGQQIAVVDGYESIADQLTSARLSSNLHPTSPFHKRSISAIAGKKAEEPLVLVLRQQKTLLGPSRESTWKEVEERLASVNDSAVQTKVKKLKDEVRNLKEKREEERSERICLISNLEEQLYSLSQENAELKRTLASVSRAKEKAVVDLQNVQLSLLESSAKIQTLMLSKLRLESTLEERDALVKKLEEEKEAATEETFRLSVRISSLESTLQCSYSRILSLTDAKSVPKSADSPQFSPPDLLTDSPSAPTVSASPETDLLDLSCESPRPTLRDLLQRARSQIVPRGLGAEAESLKQREVACKAAIQAAEGTAKSELELDLLLIQQSLATVLTRMSRASLRSNC